MRLLILAGGRGTRLKSVSRDVPKALVPICGIPFLQLQLAHWYSQGLRKFTFLLHYGSDQIIKFLDKHKDGLLKNFEIDWVIESAPMDTGGAVANAVKLLKIRDNFLLTNADTWLGHGLSDLASLAAPGMAVVNLYNQDRYGQVRFDDNMFVTHFEEKAVACSGGWINAGSYHLAADLFKDWDSQPFRLEHDRLSSWAKSSKLTALPLRTDFIDIGIPEDYYRFTKWIESGRLGSL